MKKVFQILILTLILIIPTKVNALDLEMSHKEVFGYCVDSNEESTPIILPSYDNYGIIDGHLILRAKSLEKSGIESIIKYSLDNKIVYEKNENLVDDNIDIETIEVSDGNKDILITKYDNSGNTVFEKKYAGSGIENAIVIFNSFDNKGKHNGYILLLASTSTDINTDPGLILVKFSLTGEVIWEYNINNYIPSIEPGVFYVQKGKIDSIFSYGSNNSIFKIDPLSGDILLEKGTGIEVKGITASYDEYGHMDGFVIIGHEREQALGTIIKYDLEGNEVFRKNHPVASYYSSAIASLNEDREYDGYIVVGFTEDKNFIAKYDFTGNLVWQDYFSDYNIGTEYKITENYDNISPIPTQNGYLLYSVAGNTYDYDYILYRKNNLSFDRTTKNNLVQNLSLKKVRQDCYSNFTILKYTYQRYKIEGQGSDEGIIVVNTTGYPGEIVKVDVTPRKGYSLKRIVVMTSSGKEVEVSSDGTFVMPDEKVTVLALYNKVTNPDTVSACYIVLGIVLLISLGTLIVTKKKALD